MSVGRYDERQVENGQDIELLNKLFQKLEKHIVDL